MKLLLEQWREYLSEGMKSPADIPDDVYIGIVEDSGDMNFYYADKEGDETRRYPTGLIIIRQPTERKGMWGGDGEKDGACSGAWIIAGSEASKGWGPLLYDVAIEWASMSGNGKGLTPDRHSVSGDALSVWDYYLNKRSDVKDYQLDDLENTLTNTEDDNCDQQSADAGSSDWQVSPLSKKYTKAPTTIAQLEKMGKLIDRTKAPKL